MFGLFLMLNVFVSFYESLIQIYNKINHASPPAMTSRSPLPLIGQSTPFGPAHSDCVTHPPHQPRLVEREQQKLTAARDYSLVKGKMEKNTGAVDFNILLATDSYKVSKDPKPSLGYTPVNLRGKRGKGNEK